MPADIDLMIFKDKAPTSVKSGEVFPANKKVALVTIPGALTSTCQNSHIPHWMRAADQLRAKGADKVVCVSVNDPFVMGVFERELGGEGGLEFVCDGGGKLAKALDLEFDTGAFGGVRMVRGGFLVADRVFEQVNLEEGGAYEGPAQPETLLAQM